MLNTTAVAHSSFPVALDLEGRKVVVVGTGDEAFSRSRSLIATGARVTVIGREPIAGLRELASGGALTLEERDVTPADLDGAWLLVLSDRDAPLADFLEAEAEARRLFYCAVDDTRVGSFSHLAIARAGLLFAAIGSQGEAPALSRRLRELLEELFRRSKLSDFTERLAELRRRTPSERRRAVLDRAVRSLRLDGELVVPDTLEVTGEAHPDDG